MSGPRPNLVVFFADNLGYGDIGAFGGITPTPHVDQLAAEGLRLKNWNSGASLCSPSRAALMTGRLEVRTGVYPAVFKSDAVNGLPQNETTVAEFLSRSGYATAAVGKWHLGQRPQYLPPNRGFDEYLGVPYSMDMGSLDGVHCATDTNDTMWLPVMNGTRVAQQPAVLSDLAQRYASRSHFKLIMISARMTSEGGHFSRRYAAFARDFIGRSVQRAVPFFLYVPFSHVHQLCEPTRGQWSSSAFHGASGVGPFGDAVAEMDWITGQVMAEQAERDIDEATLTLWTSDDGPWTAEQQSAGSTGPFQARWFAARAPAGCFSCPAGYVNAPTAARPVRCVCAATRQTAEVEMDGLPCGCLGLLYFTLQQYIWTDRNRAP